MDAHDAGLIELIHVFGLALGWGVWELWSVKRGRKGKDER